MVSMRGAGNHHWSGAFIVLEGIDGCGKSTLAQNLYDSLQAKNLPVILTAEPSSGDIGRLIRQNLTQTHLPAALDALLFAADRIDHGFREILPALQAGSIVICDRYKDSSLVYQAEQGKPQGITSDWVTEINRYSLVPDKIYLLDLNAQASLARRTKANSEHKAELEKFEQLPFQQSIRQRFLALANADPNDNHVILDASQPPDTLFGLVHQDLVPLLRGRGFSL